MKRQLLATLLVAGVATLGSLGLVSSVGCDDSKTETKKETKTQKTDGGTKTETKEEKKTTDPDDGDTTTEKTEKKTEEKD